LNESNKVVCADNYFSSSKSNNTGLTAKPYFELVRYGIVQPQRDAKKERKDSDSWDRQTFVFLIRYFLRLTITHSPFAKKENPIPVIRQLSINKTIFVSEKPFFYD
jgi:hypothetical protein